MRLYVGTSGFAYREWKGGFYPPTIADRELLAWYAQRLGAVELNNTFYRFPTAEGLAAWASQVPAGFRFALKVPRRITHLKRLRDVDGDVAYLIEVAATLGRRLGPLLFQLPPRMPCDLELLQGVTALLPPRIRAAFEFRHPSWHCEAVYGVLREQGCALCFNDTAANAPQPTGDWGYVRLRREHYAEAELAASAAQVLAQPWREAHVFFKHAAPDVPLLAQRWARLAAAFPLQG